MFDLQVRLELVLASVLSNVFPSSPALSTRFAPSETLEPTLIFAERVEHRTGAADALLANIRLD